jgi:DNA-binding transcriptional ArsR family regulator
MSTVDGATGPSTLFAALGDPTRLDLIARLSDGGSQSITALCANIALTRQAVSKHLKVLEGAGLVIHQKKGRESHYTFRPERLEDAQTYLARVSRQWDDALERLRKFVEQPH